MTMVQSTNADRELYIRARALILRALDLLDRRFGVGKYKGVSVEPLIESVGVTIASAVIEDDKLPTV